MDEEKTRLSGVGIPSTTGESAKKKSYLNFVALAAVFLFGIVLPPKYKAFAPILLLIPFVYSVVEKARRISGKADSAATDPRDEPRTHLPASSGEPYSCEPGDPRDPRRYKPIG